MATPKYTERVSNLSLKNFSFALTGDPDSKFEKDWDMSPITVDTSPSLIRPLKD